MPKNKILFTVYLVAIVVLSVSNSFALFLLATIIAFFIGGGRRFILLKRAFAGVIFFTGFALFGSVVAAFVFGSDIDYVKTFVLFCRSFSIAFLTLSIVDRVGILRLFGFSPALSLFFAMIFAKIEMLSKEINDFKEAARSRGMQVSFKDAISLLSVAITALLLKSIDGFTASYEALKSRGYSA